MSLIVVKCIYLLFFSGKLVYRLLMSRLAKAFECFMFSLVFCLQVNLMTKYHNISIKIQECEFVFTILTK